MYKENQNQEKQQNSDKSLTQLETFYMKIIAHIRTDFVVRYFIINIKRLKGYNIFTQSRLLNWTLTLLLIYLGTRNIMDISMKGNSGIRIYIEVLLYGVTVYQLLKSTLYKQEVTVENIHKPQLESIIEDIFSKWNLSLIKEESDDNITTFSLHDQYIESKISINSTAFSKS